MVLSRDPRQAMHPCFAPSPQSLRKLWGGIAKHVGVAWRRSRLRLLLSITLRVLTWCAGPGTPSHLSGLEHRRSPSFTHGGHRTLLLYSLRRTHTHTHTHPPLFRTEDNSVIIVFWIFLLTLSVGSLSHQCFCDTQDEPILAAASTSHQGTSSKCCHLIFLQ